MTAETEIAALTLALDIKRRDHAATLGLLAHAYEVIERDRIGYERLLRLLWTSRRGWQDRASARAPKHAGFDTVTTATARRAHLARPGDKYTLCDAVAARPAGRVRSLTQDWIEAMALCPRCARKAGAS